MPRYKVRNINHEQHIAAGYLKLKVLNVLETQVDRNEYHMINKILKYEETIYTKQKRQIKRRLIEKTFVRHFSAKSPILIFTGNLPRILKHYPYTHIDYENAEGIILHARNILEPKVSRNITLRPDQLAAIEKIRENSRGVIVEPTGTGKTVVMAGMVSCYRKFNILILANTIGLVTQTATEINKLTGLKPQILTGKSAIDWKFLEQDIDLINDGTLVISTIQSFQKLDPDKYSKTFDVVIVDECFYKKTKIKTKYGEKEIQHIQIGELIKTKQGMKPVTKIFKTKVPLERICKVNLSNGKSIYCSVDHIFKTQNGEIKAQNLKKNQLLTN